MPISDASAINEFSWIDIDEEINSFRRALILWGKENFVVFPWRLTHDAYVILMAEIMLHRTQVKQVVPVFEKFIKKFPTISMLIRADHNEVSESLSSLGLSWRIDLINRMVTEIDSRFNGLIPQRKEELLSLPGVSEYIAGAVRCFAWGYSDALIDTNTVRITGRLFCLEVKDSSRRNPQFRMLIQKLVDPENPATFNYAFLDLAHLVCHKKIKPDCHICPINAFCCFGQRELG